MRNKLKERKGITLIALVITIIVLLILAGVTIATLTGENGILTKASEAKEKTELTDEKEKVQLSATGALTKATGGEINQENLEEELGKYFSDGKYAVEVGNDEDGTEGYIVTITENEPEGRKYFVDRNGNTGDYTAKEPAKPTEGIGTNFRMSYGVIEVEFLSGTSYNTTSIPNHPLLKENMTAITYNESDGAAQNIDNSSGTDWYSYVATTDSDMTDGGTTDGGNSHWANAKVTIDNVDSYFVWIPRYAYRIIYFDSQDSKNAYMAGTLSEEKALDNNQIVGYSDARGIVDVEGRTKEGVAVQTAISVNDKYFKTHPAFENNVDYGGWSSKLQGIWVSKYEASSVEGNSNSISGDNVTTKTVKIQPGVSSWRYIAINNAFTNAQAYSVNLQSHLMKNSEWGAVVYLTESKFGRNGTEVATNNSSSYITGSSEGNSSESSSDITYQYYTEKGVLASSTGNVYGIYDLSGGATERVTGYYKDGESSILDYGSLFTKNKISDIYSTAYDGTSSNTDYKYGDATYEVAGWHNDRSMFVGYWDPFFSRGGIAQNGGEGIFYYVCSNHSMARDAAPLSGFRVCLIIE